jgi:hypothetical protein
MNEHEEHPDEHYYGGHAWKMGSPVHYTWMISSAGQDRFVLVTDPNDAGSELWENENTGEVFFSLDELKDLFKNADYLGEFRNTWREIAKGALGRLGYHHNIDETIDRDISEKIRQL